MSEKCQVCQKTLAMGWCGHCKELADKNLFLKCVRDCLDKYERQQTFRMTLLVMALLLWLLAIPAIILFLR